MDQNVLFVSLAYSNFVILTTLGDNFGHLVDSSLVRVSLMLPFLAKEEHTQQVESDYEKG